VTLENGVCNSPQLPSNGQVVDSSLLGWAILRSRQFALLILKTWRFPVIKYGSKVPDVTVALFVSELSWGSDFKRLFHRTCQYSWPAFISATVDELNADRQWALARKSVIERHANPADDEFADDDPDSYLWALQTNERKRYEWCKTHAVAEVRDVQQNPDTYVIGSRGKNMSTLIKNMGILMLPEQPPPGTTAEHLGPVRAFHYNELFQAMGFPIYPWAQELTCGTRCSFSHGSPTPALRTRASAQSALGNTMHVNAVGGMHLEAILKFPDLGDRISGVDDSGLGDHTTSVSASASSATFGSTPCAAAPRTVGRTLGMTTAHRQDRELGQGTQGPSKFLETLRKLKRHKSG